MVLLAGHQIGHGRALTEYTAAPFRDGLQEDVAGRCRRVERTVTVDAMHLDVTGEAESSASAP